MAADIFVSFASKDVRVAMTLCGALENRGFTCWISARDIEPGENFQSAIVRALRRAKIMLLVFTANSNTSEEMTKELALASQNKMIVIPLRVEDVTPNDAFAYEFATRQWIDVFADWEVAIEQLSRRIGQALLDRETTGRAGAAADALKTVIASANAKKMADPPPPVEDAPAIAAQTEAAAAEADPAAEHPVEAAVKALEALEASAGAEAAAAVPEAAFEASPIAAGASADAELPPASEDDPWRAADAAPAQPDAPARKPAGLLIIAALAILALIGIVAALANRSGRSPAPTVQAATSEAPPAAVEPASAPPASSTSAAPASSAPPAAAAPSDTESSGEAAAPKPAKRKKAQPKVDIPF